MTIITQLWLGRCRKLTIEFSSAVEPGGGGGADEASVEVEDPRCPCCGYFLQYFLPRVAASRETPLATGLEGSCIE